MGTNWCCWKIMKRVGLQVLNFVYKIKSGRYFGVQFRSNQVTTLILDPKLGFISPFVSGLMHVFSTSDISYQMCYCCQKLDFQGNLKSASNVQLSDWLRERILYIWGRFSIHIGRFSIHLRQILYTFEANLYIWGRDNLFSHVMPLSQSENRICTFQIRPQMYRESASNV